MRARKTGTRLRLLPWNPEVSFGNRLVAIELMEAAFSTSKAEKASKYHGDGADIVGFYARYTEGMYVYFQDPNGKFVIGWRSKLIELAVLSINGR